MGRRYSFDLARVRDLRAHKEDLAKEQFASSLSRRVQGEAMLREAEHRLHSARNGQASDVVGPLTGAQLMSRQAFVERLERSRRDAIVDLEQREALLADARDALTRASRDREVLDRLERRQREAHAGEVERAERSESDDIAIRNHVRRNAA